MSENLDNQVYCNYKQLCKLPVIGDFDLEGTAQRKIVLMTRNDVFKKRYQTSKTMFKKLSAEDMNKKCLDASITHCIDQFKPRKKFVNFSIIFINLEGDIKEVMRLVKREVADLVTYLVSTEEITPKINTKHDLIAQDMRDAIIKMMLAQHQRDDEVTK